MKETQNAVSSGVVSYLNYDCLEMKLSPRWKRQEQPNKMEQEQKWIDHFDLIASRVSC